MSSQEFPLFWIPLLPLLGAAFNLIFGRKLPRKVVAAVACGTVAVACLIALRVILGPLAHAWVVARHHGDAVKPIVDNVFTWIQSDSLVINLRFVMDPLAGVMVFTITFVGLLIHLYSVGYMAHDPRLSTYFGYLNLFTGAMLILVLGDSLPVMFIGWEGVGTCSYLLIGFWFTEEKNANAGRKAFVTNRIGDFAFLIGIFLCWSVLHQHGSPGLDFDTMKADILKGHASALMGHPPNGMGLPFAFWIGLLLFGGAVGKSAQFPLYVWLPDAMAGPTPVSALIHAATMVTAGVYMVARLAFLYMQVPEAMMIIAGVGAFTALYAAIIGFAQTDIKKVLAYSTIPQLGFMFVGVGAGAYSAGVFHLFTHAFFKAGLFLAAGSVMHAMSDSTDIMKMGGLRKKTPVTHAVFLIYCLAIAGIPPFAGFFSKDDILLSTWVGHEGWPLWYSKVLWGVLTAAAIGTAFYMWRLYFLVFWGESRADAKTQEHIHESPGIMTKPLVVLAAAGACVLGLLGLPEIGGLKSFFAEWVNQTDPRVMHTAEGSAGLTLGLMGLATAGALAGIFAAYALYKNGPLGATTNPLVRLVQKKFYVDEGLEYVYRAFRFVCMAIYRVVDRLIIDMILVGTWGFLSSIFGRIATSLQNGDMQRYLVAMLLGIAAIFYLPTCSWVGNAPDFTTTIEPGNAVRVHAELGQGIARHSSRVDFDFEGKGQFSVAGPNAEFPYTKPGKYEIDMRVTDVFGRETIVKKQVAVGDQMPKIGGAR